MVIFAMYAALLAGLYILLERFVNVPVALGVIIVIVLLIACGRGREGGDYG